MLPKPIFKQNDQVKTQVYSVVLRHQRSAYILDILQG